MTTDDDSEVDRREGVEPTTLGPITLPTGRELGPVTLPDGTEDETGRDGFLSAIDEWHALGIGFLIGLTGHIEIIALFTAFLLGEYDGLRKTDHVEDAMLKPGYACLGIILGLVVHLWLWATIVDDFAGRRVL